MKRQDLRENMVVEYREGARRVFRDGRLKGIDGFNLMEHYNEDLTNDAWDGNSIDKVFISKGDTLEELLTESNLILKWSRKEGEIKMDNTKTFAELIREIKEGETWEGIADWNLTIVGTGSKSFEIHFKEEIDRYSIDGISKFRLREEIDFAAAIEAYDNGETIQSLETKSLFKIEDGKNFTKPLNLNWRETSEMIIYRSELEGKWTIAEEEKEYLLEDC